MKNQWVPQYNTWSYAGKNGEFLTQGWHVVDNSWYYFKYGKTIACDEIITDNQSRTYKMDKSGLYVKNQWVPRYNTWSYAGKNGEFLTQGWHVVDRNWYYFEYDTIACNKTIIDTQGRQYRMDKSGHYIKNQWIRLTNYNGVTWLYARKDGELLTSGWHVVDNSWYYFGYNGEMARNEFITDSQSKTYKIDGSGHYVKSQWVPYYDNTWKYAGKDGALLENTWAKIGGVWYYFNYGGSMAHNELIRDKDNNYYWINSLGYYVTNRDIPYYGKILHAGADGRITNYY